MSNMEQVGLLLSKLQLALQVCLFIWQFIKLTPVGALIKGVVGWSLRPRGLLTTYTLLQRCRGRVFKDVKSYVLQADLLSKRRHIAAGRRDTLTLYYLGVTFLLERRRSESEMNMLFINGVMRYYITPQIWDELETLTHVLNVDILMACFDVAEDRLAAEIVAAVKKASVKKASDVEKAADVDIAPAADVDIVPAADIAPPADVAAVAFRVARRHGLDCAYGHGDNDASIALLYASVFVKGQREFWEAMSMGGVMTVEEVLDEIILYNKHVSARLNDDWLLPVNLSVSEEKLLKIMNLFGLFLKTKKVSVYWLISTLLSFISALLEFSTKIRVCIYEHINLCFCYMMHFICDPLPRSWRRQVYSLGKWVENLKPCNDIEQKIVRGNMRATIAGGAKVDKQGATFVQWIKVDLARELRYGPVDREFRCKAAKSKSRRAKRLNVDYDAEEQSGYVEREFRCNPIDIDIKCMYSVGQRMCYISAPKISAFRVDCDSPTKFERIITFVSSIAKNGCGSLKSYGPHNKVSVRGFRESVIFYIKSGFPRVYELELHNVVVA